MLGAAAGAGFKGAFELIDVNGNGYVTKTEMRRVVDSVGKGKAGDEFIKAIAVTRTACTPMMKSRSRISWASWPSLRLYEICKKETCKPVHQDYSSF